MHNPTSFPSQPQTVSGASHRDIPHRFKPTGGNKNLLLDKIIPDIEAVGKLISYAKALDMLIENARAHGDFEDWDELDRKSKEAWAEIKRRNREQKEELEGIIGFAVGDRMDFGGVHPSQDSRMHEDHNEEGWSRLGKTEYE